MIRPIGLKVILSQHPSQQKGGNVIRPTTKFLRRGVTWVCDSMRKHARLYRGVWGHAPPEIV